MQSERLSTLSHASQEKKLQKNACVHRALPYTYFLKY